MTQLSADEKVGKLFALAIITETALGREVLKQRCDPDFDAKRKERAGRFKPTEEVYTLRVFSILQLFLLPFTSPVSLLAKSHFA